MSWFTGEGLTTQLTTFKDQITTFTKDVLTETTDEIEDPVGELRLAKQRIYELEKSEALQRDEHEKAKQHKDELTERAETAEFQIATLSQEYRKLFQEKDEQRQILKEENVRLKDQLRSLLLSHDDKSPGVVSNSVIMNDGLHDDGMDNISDLISSQAEINKLSSQLAKITAECQYWKEVANQNKVSGPVDVDSISVQLEELKRQLTLEQEQHQRELSALQHVHDENMQTLVRRHRAELEQQQQLSPTNDRTSDLVDELAAKNEQLENLLNESTQLFEEETQSLKMSLEQKEKVFEEQQVQLKEDSQSLASSLAACQDRVINYQSRIDHLQVELASSQNMVDSLNIKLTQEQQVKEKLCSELDELRRRLAAASDEQVAKVQQEREQMKEELVTLQQKISTQINTISHLEQAHDKVNHEMEQMTLLLAARETDIVNLQSKREEDLQQTQQQLSKELTAAKLDNDQLKKQIEELMMNKEKLCVNKETQTAIIRDEVTTSEGSQEMLQLEHTATSEQHLQAELSRKEETINSLREQVQQFTEQLQVTTCHSCSQLKKQVEDLQMKFEPLEGRAVTADNQNKELREEIKKLQESHIAQLDEVTSEKNRLHSELAKCSKELERLKSHLLQVEEENSEEIIGFQQRENNLKLKVKQAEEQLSASMNRKELMSQESQQKIDQLTEQLYAIAQQRDSLSLQLNTVQDENEQLQQQVTNLQIVLEEFQKDQSSKFNSNKQQYEKELILITKERNSLLSELEEAKRQLAHASASLEGMEALHLQLQTKEQLVKDLQQQVENFQLHLMNREQKFSLLSEQEENRVDKELVKNLFIGYLTAVPHKKNEVLKLITSILEFSPIELEQITKQGSSGWISSLWRKATPPSSPADQQTSFSKLFIKFLESESIKQNSPATAVTMATSYIDPRTDPDKPLLATAAMVTAGPSVSVPHRVPSLPTFAQVTNDNKSTSQVTTSNTTASQVYPTGDQPAVKTHPHTSTVTMTTNNVSQNVILSELLTSTNVQ